MIERIIEITKTMYVAAPSPRHVDGNILFASREECETHNQKCGRDWPIFQVGVTITLP